MVEKANEEFANAVGEYADEAKTKSRAFVDLIQSFFGCCGVNAGAEYLAQNVKIPESCNLKDDVTKVFTKGCSSVVPEKLKADIVVAAGVALGAGAVMVRYVRNIIVSLCEPKTKHLLVD